MNPAMVTEAPAHNWPIPSHTPTPPPPPPTPSTQIANGYLYNSPSTNSTHLTIHTTALLPLPHNWLFTQQNLHTFHTTDYSHNRTSIPSTQLTIHTTAPLPFPHTWLFTQQPSTLSTHLTIHTTVPLPLPHNWLFTQQPLPCPSTQLFTQQDLHTFHTTDYSHNSTPPHNWLFTQQPLYPFHTTDYSHNRTSIPSTQLTIHTTAPLPLPHNWLFTQQNLHTFHTTDYSHNSPCIISTCKCCPFCHTQGSVQRPNFTQHILPLGTLNGLQYHCVPGKPYRINPGEWTQARDQLVMEWLTSWVHHGRRSWRAAEWCCGLARAHQTGQQPRCHCRLVGTPAAGQTCSPTRTAPLSSAENGMGQVAVKIHHLFLL